MHIAPELSTELSTDLSPEISRFETHFNRHVTPRLVNLCRLGALLVHLDLESFSAAHWIVMDHARKHGALHLSARSYDLLADWVDRRLLREIDAYERGASNPPQGLLTRAQRTRLAADISRCDQAWGNATP